MTNSKGETIWCDNVCCDAEAVQTVPVSIDSPGDAERHYCFCCAEAYHVGSQHARREERETFKEALRCALKLARDLGLELP